MTSEKETVKIKKFVQRLPAFLLDMQVCYISAMVYQEYIMLTGLSFFGNYESLSQKLAPCLSCL